MCKKQTSDSHSSTESEIISLDAGLRLDGLPALELWDFIVSVHGKHDSDSWKNGTTRCDLWQSSRAKRSDLKEWSTFWIILIVFSQTSNFRIKKLCCMCLRTTKQWSRWLSKEGVPQWGMFPGPTELRLIGFSIESIWTQKIQIKYIDTKNQLADALWEWWIPQNYNKTCVYFGSWWIFKTACGRIFTKSSWRPYCRKRKKFTTAL